MTVTAAIVVFAVVWFMVFFIVLPLRLTTQGDAGQVEPGTPLSAPAGFVVARKARITTLVAVLVWAVICGVVLSGAITIRDIDVFNRMGPAPAQAPITD